MQFADNPKVQVFLMTGFLESGKTLFLSETLPMEYFRIDGTTVLILCEEGEEEFDPQMLKETNTILLTVNSPEELSLEKLQEINKKYQPERVIFECNGMYPVSKMEALEVPTGWGLIQEICTIDAASFDLYLTNMKSLFTDMVRNAEMVVFNRCSPKMPLASYRRSVKVVNQAAEIIFEDQDGEEIENIFDEEMPFDIDAPVIQIDDIDFGIWYIDTIDHPERYDGKVVEFCGEIKKPRRLASDQFIVGRTAMTCCADDMTFLGFVVRSKHAASLKSGQWIQVKGKISYEYHPIYREEGPVVQLQHGKGVQKPEDGLVYFN